MTPKKLFEDSLSSLITGLLTAGLIAFITMTYQVVGMKTELVGLRRDVTRIESMVTALLTREEFHRGSDEVLEIARLAKAFNKAKQPSSGGLEAAEK